MKFSFPFFPLLGVLLFAHGSALAASPWVQEEKPHAGNVYSLWKEGNDLFALVTYPDGVASKSGYPLALSIRYVSSDGGDTWRVSTSKSSPFPMVNGYPDNGRIERDGAILDYSNNYTATMSPDGGATWYAVGPPRVPTSTVTGVGYFGGAFFCSAAGEAWRTRDGGINWEKVSPAEAGTSSSIQFVANEDCILAISNNKVFLSADTGTTWTGIPLEADFPPNPTYGAYIQGAGSSFYLKRRETAVPAVAGPKIWHRSLDSGRTWKPFAKSLPAPMHETLSLGRIVEWGHRILLMTPLGILASEDSGATWKPTMNGIQKSVLLEMAPMGNMLAARTTLGVFMADSGLSQWTNLNAGLGFTDYCTGLELGLNSYNPLYHFRSGYTPPPMPKLAATRNTLFILTPEGSLPAGSGTPSGKTAGIRVSRDGGRTWALSDSGLNAAAIESGTFKVTYLAAGDDWVVIRAGGEVIKMGSRSFIQNHGAYLSKDEGRSWIPLKPAPGMDTSRVYTMGLDGQRIYVAGGMSDIYYSDDEGKSWEGMGLPDNEVLQEFRYRGCRIMHFSKTRIYLQSDFAGVFAVDKGNPGESKKLPMPIGSKIVIGSHHVGTLGYTFETLGDTLFCGTDSGFFVSADQGMQWTRIHEGIAKDAVSSNALTVMGNRLYCGTLSGNLRSLPLPIEIPTGVRGRPAGGTTIPGFEVRIKPGSMPGQPLTLTCRVPSPARITVSFSDAGGKQVGSLGKTLKASALHEFQWTPPSGPAIVYFRYFAHSLHTDRKLLFSRSGRLGP